MHPRLHRQLLQHMNETLSNPEDLYSVVYDYEDRDSIINYFSNILYNYRKCNNPAPARPAASQPLHLQHHCHSHSNEMLAHEVCYGVS